MPLFLEDLVGLLGNWLRFGAVFEDDWSCMPAGGRELFSSRAINTLLETGVGLAEGFPEGEPEGGAEGVFVFGLGPLEKEGLPDLAFLGAPMKEGLGDLGPLGALEKEGPGVLEGLRDFGSLLAPLGALEEDGTRVSEGPGVLEGLGDLGSLLAPLGAREEDGTGVSDGEAVDALGTFLARVRKASVTLNPRGDIGLSVCSHLGLLDPEG